MRVRLLAQLTLAIVLAAHVPDALVQSVEVSGRGVPYPAVWPKGPAKDSVPDWAAPGRIRFARWDGGRIEVAKAFLSGWVGLNPPHPDLLHSMANWYDPRTISFLKEAAINLVWVTFSVGFSNQTEQAHQAEVRRYITECHRQGIRVMAYESIANMFWEDMFQVVPESKSWIALGRDGKPVPYGAGTYERMGRVTRYMADLRNPNWRGYLLKRLDLAIESGADGVMFDNNFGNGLFGLYQEIMNHVAGRKKDFLVMANFHADTYALNRLLNCITTEDGLEPGLYSSSSEGYPGIASHHPFLLPVDGKFLVNNFGLLSVHETLADGWKPVMIEDGRRELADRLVSFMSPARAQLALAENMTFGIALEQYVEGGPAHGLMTGDPASVDTWRAIGNYNRFFDAHPEIYVGARSHADLAIVIDDRSEGIPLLDGLAARRVPFVVRYERDLTPESISRYKAVALLTARIVHSSAVAGLEAFVRAGGKLLVAQDSATLDEAGTRRSRPAFINGKLGSGEVVYLDQLPPPDLLAQRLIQLVGTPLVRLDAPQGILYNVTRNGGRRFVHLLNYTLKPSTDIRLQVSGRYASARLISPDTTDVTALSGATARGADLKIPRLQTYSIVVLDDLK